jgi:hypothetical protein
VLVESGDGNFVEGLEAAFRLDAFLALGGFLISVFLIGGKPHLERLEGLPHRLLAGHSPRGHGP